MAKRKSKKDEDSGTWQAYKKQKNFIYHQRSYWKKKIQENLVDDQLKDSLISNLRKTSDPAMFANFKDFFKGLRDIQNPSIDKASLSLAFDLLDSSLTNINVGKKLKDSILNDDSDNSLDWYDSITNEEKSLNEIHEEIEQELNSTRMAERYDQLTSSQGKLAAIQWAQEMGIGTQFF